VRAARALRIAARSAKCFSKRVPTRGRIEHCATLPSRNASRGRALFDFAQPMMQGSMSSGGVCRSRSVVLQERLRSTTQMSPAPLQHAGRTTRVPFVTQFFEDSQAGSPAGG